MLLIFEKIWLMLLETPGMNFRECADLFPMSSSGSRRIIELDVLRGIAVIMAMGPHVLAYPVWAKVGTYLLPGRGGTLFPPFAHSASRSGLIQAA